MRVSLLALIGVLLFPGNTVAPQAATAQQVREPQKPPEQSVEDDGLRGIWLEAFRRNRRPAPGQADATTTKPSKPSPPEPSSATKPTLPKSAQRAKSGKPAVTHAPAFVVNGDAFIGITIWRLRTARSDDDTRALVHEPSRPEGWVPERIDTASSLIEGARIRLSIESARRGFLYVIDTEDYSDGSTGVPHLIFPTLRTRGGRNDVAPGELIEIPEQSDRPPYLTARRASAAHVGETLVVLVTPEPLHGIELGLQALRLSPSQVAQWIQQWSAPVTRIDAVAGVGDRYSPEEKEAAERKTRALTQDDPVPQTVYHVAAPSTTPLVIRVPLRFADKSGR